MKPIQQTIIRFPEIKLRTRDAHKLRGYFGDFFKEHSPLLHNHYKSGGFRYRYPLVQYKVLDETPALVAFEDGAQLLTSLFLKMKEIDIDGRKYDINAKQIDQRKVDIGYANELYEYQFQTLWMGLNQENYKVYQDKDEKERSSFLERVLVGNVLSFFKNMDLRLEDNERLLCKANLREKQTKFKNQKMLAFDGSFVMNAVLPDNAGIGKAVSRGFGTISQT